MSETDTITSDIETRVARGVAVLDHNAGNWRGDVQTPDMGDDLGCVLALVFGSYQAGLSFLELSQLQAEDCGFDIDTRCDLAREWGYAELTAAWLDVLDEWPV